MRLKSSDIVRKRHGRLPEKMLMFSKHMVPRETPENTALPENCSRRAMMIRSARSVAALAFAGTLKNSDGGNAFATKRVTGHPDDARNAEIATWTQADMQNLTLREFGKLTSTNFTALFDRMKQLGNADLTIAGFTLEEIGQQYTKISNQGNPDGLDIRIGELATKKSSREVASLETSQMAA